MSTTLALAWRMARRERRGGIRGFGIFLGCLMLGVAAIAAVGSVGEGIQAALKADGRVLLGGDVDLRSTHRPVGTAELRWLESHSERLSQTAQTRVMAKKQGGGKRVLTELKAVDGAYPLFGTLGLENGIRLDAALKPTAGAYGAAAEPQLMQKLGLAVGDAIRIGAATFRINGVIAREPDRSAQAFRLGPRLLVGFDGLEATGIVRPGSLIRYHYRLDLGDKTDHAKWIERLTAAFPEAGWRIRSVANAAPRIQRFTDRVGLFLSLVGLTTLLVGGVGIGTGVASFINGRLATIATFKCLGAPGGLVFTIYLIQVLLIAAIGIAGGLAIGALAPLAAQPLLQDKLDIASRIGLYPVPLLTATAFGVLITLVFSLWPLGRARDIAPAALFRAVIAPLSGRPKAGYLAVLAGLTLTLAGFTIATAYLSHIAAWFVLGAAAAFAIFRLAAAAIMALMRRMPHFGNAAVRLAFANIHRPGAATATVTLALGLGLTVLTAVVLIEGNLARQVDNAIPKKAPAYYFLDIQPGQVDAFRRIAESHPGVDHIGMVPMLRGRILKMNGVSTRKIKPPPDVAWVLRGDRGLTFSAEPPGEGSEVVAGEWWPKDYAGAPLVSFDKQKADAFGLKIGDTLTVNLLGRPLTARIANLRRIDWSSLSINFLMIFSPGSMQGAPLSYLATARFAADAPDPGERALADKITDRFANISAIRVKDVLSDVSKMVADIGTAVRAIAAVAVLAGVMVLAGAIAASHRRRIYDSVVLKVLGATRRRLLSVYALEYGLLGIVTAVIASAIGTLAAWAVVVHVMRAEWAFLPAPLLWTALLSLGITVACGFAGSWIALGQKPAGYLRNE